MNKYKAILFDLDGTLLSMDEPAFIKAYITAICTEFAGRLDPKKLQAALWTGMEAMQTKDGPNEAIMWQVLESTFGPEIRAMEEDFKCFYSNGFHKAKDSCAPVPEARALLESLKGEYRLVLATDPIFPKEAVLSRLEWAGIDPETFEWITTYETNRACKPDTAYYTDLLERLELDPASVLMVGNDVQKDMEGAQSAGISGYLIECPCTINRKDTDWDGPKGTWSGLETHLKSA